MSLDTIREEAAKEFAPAGVVTDQAAPAPGASPVPAVDPDEAEAVEWSKCPAVFGMILARVMPELKGTYTVENNIAWGRAMVPLAHRYGWTAAEFFAWLGPWVGIAIATEPLAMPTYDAIRAKLAERRKAREEVAAAPASDTAAKP